MIHGKSDDMINYRHAEQLFELISTRKLLISPPAMLHNTNLMNDASRRTKICGIVSELCQIQFESFLFLLHSLACFERPLRI